MEHRLKPASVNAYIFDLYSPVKIIPFFPLLVGGHEKSSIMIKRVVIITALFILVLNTVDATSIPFKLAGKLIVIEATVAGQPGNYIIDTGISETILNSAYFEGTPTGEKMVGINGREIPVLNTVVNFKIGNLKWPLVEAKTLPLQHLSQAKDMPIMGLIGTEMLRLFTMTIDFETQTLELSKSGSWDQDSHSSPDAIFKFWWKAGIPVISMTAGDESLDFALDTGAEINLLSEVKSRDLSQYFTLDQKGRNIAGLSKNSRMLPAGQIQNLELGEYLCPKMRVALISLSHYNNRGAAGRPVDGLVGYEFLHHLKVTINFKKRIIYAWNRDLDKEQFLVSR